MGLIFWWFIGFCVAAQETPTQYLKPMDISKTLTLTKGKSLGAFYVQFKSSDEYYDNDCSRQTTLADGTQQHYYDFRSVFSGWYGLTDHVNFWLSIPFVLRKESKFFHLQDFGLGDVSAGGRYLIWSSQNHTVQWGMDIIGKFPTGNTSIGNISSKGEYNSKLPLGTGNFDLSMMMVGKQTFHPSLVLDFHLGYMFRFDALVDYLTTSQVNFSDSNHTIYTLPIGNLRIDWGDQIHTQGKLSWIIKNKIILSLASNFIYYRPTTIQNFVFSEENSEFASTTLIQKSTDGFLVQAIPGASIKLNKKANFFVYSHIPIVGKNYTLTSLAFLESMVGYEFELGIQYEF